eukprot:TRINITY_DN67852_c5_g9_i1.p1 TRINITY_DN67852_c5_g9~~TRINITY_DN67852_c5_g9_i1.p1  ORF type:complete len:155 (-),score=13.24 TRINITY_DN67852_c5_g9_i1:80-514(-)
MSLRLLVLLILVAGACAKPECSCFAWRTKTKDACEAIKAEDEQYRYEGYTRDFCIPHEDSSLKANDKCDEITFWATSRKCEGDPSTEKHDIITFKTGECKPLPQGIESPNWYMRIDCKPNAATALKFSMLSLMATLALLMSWLC